MKNELSQKERKKERKKRKDFVRNYYDFDLKINKK
jgi:hypothetical protein